MRMREEVFNVVLAQLLSHHGLVAVPEGMDRGGHRPDVVVNFYGLRLIIEGKVDERGAESRLAEQAEGRLKDGLGHVVLAVLYPRGLREQDPESLEKALEGASFRVRVFSEAGGDDWKEVRGVSELAEHLRRVREGLTREDVVAEAVKELEEAISTASGYPWPSGTSLGWDFLSPFYLP
jgi:hypothetical protein